MPTSLETYAPFDAGAGASVTEATWRKFMRHMLGSASGIIRGFSNEFNVIADGSGMNVKVDTGECWIRGHYGESTTLKTFSLAAAHATLGRQDRVVLRADFTNNRVEIDVLTGTAAASPVAPAVTQSTTIWETSLFIVIVAAAATSISTPALRDRRVYTTVNSKFARTNNVQSIPNVTTTKFSFTDTVLPSGDVLSIDGSDFEIQRAGLWVITARGKYTANGTGGREISIIDATNILNVYGSQTCGGVTGMNSLLSCVANERFPVGQRISMGCWQNSGGALNVDNGDLTFTWVGP